MLAAIIQDSFLFLLAVSALVLLLFVIAIGDRIGLVMADWLIGWQKRKELNHDRFK